VCGLGHHTPSDQWSGWSAPVLALALHFSLTDWLVGGLALGLCGACPTWYNYLCHTLHQPLSEGGHFTDTKSGHCTAVHPVHTMCPQGFSNTAIVDEPRTASMSWVPLPIASVC
jgi:hypothetical protein